MREVKFRAWDGESVRYDVTGLEHGIKNEMAGVFLDGEYYSLSSESLTASMDGRHAILMQYTGLKDKSGVEIYEGDIVKAPDLTDRGDGMFDDGLLKIVWDDARAGFVGIGQSGDISGMGCWTYDDSTTEFEVVTSIHQNPEFLVTGDAA